MCVITSALVAGGLATIGATSMAASTTAVALTTMAANAVLGAGLSAGVSAATGARGRDVWMAAAIGGATGGAMSGLGMAVGGVSTATTTNTFLSGSQQLAMGATDVAPGMLNPGAEVAALTNNPSAITSGTLPETTTIIGTSEGIISGVGEASAATYGMMATNLAQGSIEAYTGYQEAKEDAANLKDQAELNEIRAGQAQEAAALEKMDLARKQRQLKGTQKTAAAANGIMLETRAESSPAMFEQDAAAELAWDNAKIDYNANLEAWGYMENARLQRRQARSVRRVGNLKVATGLIKGAVGAAGTYYAGRTNAVRNSVYA